MPVYSDAPICPGSLQVFGMQVHPFEPEAMLQLIERTVSARQKAVIANLNLHALCLGLKHAWFRDFINRAQYVYSDGESVRWAARILEQPIPVKVGFTRWIWDLAGFCAAKQYRFFLLGGKQGVAEEAAAKFTARYPALIVAGTQHGYFKHTGVENTHVIEKINAARPDVVVVAFGMPYQEQWIAENWPFMQRGVYLPGGGVLDYAAGRVPAAPAWMIRLHLEWLFRVWKDPGRLAERYAKEAPVFFKTLACEKWRQIFTLPQPRTKPPESSSGKS
ncbi:MAG: hypothetical protein A2Y02_01495 [Omnitrophica bacterium GWA2_52_12]|nr:MAG: hypothetical protein A2Y02_01495 [Omnitrophica bacterium GWA2_52_12]